ncbi:MAG: FAD-dependent oxidoreductase [Bacteroidales bacterium]|nr:FAD-dependent oxidoreductase [Bacteroidales bacterium]
MKYDLIIIGSGPAGYVAAIRAGQVGLKTAIIEKDAIGGMCLNWGCIPTKALIESAKFYNRLNDAAEFGIEGIDLKKLDFNWPKAVERAYKVVNKLTNGVEFLLKKNGVETIMGEAEIVGEHEISVNNRTIEAENIIIATGSLPERIPGEGSNLDIRALYKMKKLPESIAVYGHGPVSVELAQLFNLLGVKTYLITEQEKTLIPQADQFLNDFILKKLKSQGIKIQKNLPSKDVPVLNASLRKAILPAIKPEIDLTDDGFVQTNLNLQTSVSNIYAIGDVNGRSYLAHVGSAQGVFAVNHIKGIEKRMDIRSYPLNIYTVPEMAQIGFTEQELQEENVEYKVNEMPLSINGKAMTEGDTEGVVRILSEKKLGEVMGVQIIGPNATDMIAEAAAFIEMEATIYDVARTVHAHPTVSEVFMETGMDALDKAIHK